MHPIPLNCVSITCVYLQKNPRSFATAMATWIGPEEKWQKERSKLLTPTRTDAKSIFFVTPCLVYNAFPRIFGKLLMGLQYNGLHWYLMYDSNTANLCIKKKGASGRSDRV